MKEPAEAGRDVLLFIINGELLAGQSHSYEDLRTA